eukprot:CAMPEP_0194353924 /NCGR_PEP_ID=MMETSP0174-20130528/2134_1 /TAXON_ID=216777 /ORGANISM="Proboscia alata, Strain PI-D3" /LENGTH=386 /DNA_ID=CAMNT_0039122641 /DNA_START=51 /DNA_END=1211 /DNA_ORIENTATION=-
MTAMLMWLLRLTAAALLSLPPTTTVAASSSSSPSSTTVVRAKHVVGAGLGRTGTMSFKESIVQLGFGPVFHMEDCVQHPEFTPLWEQLADLSPLETIGAVNGGYYEPIWESTTFREPNSARIQLLSQIVGIDTNTTTTTKAETTNTNTNKVYMSTMDFPTCIYFRDMIEVYKQLVDDPREVKVVLTSRETGRQWGASFLASIGNWIPALRPGGISLALYLFPPFFRYDTLFQSTFYRLFPSNIHTGYSTISKREDRLGQYHDMWNKHVRTVMQEYAQEHHVALDEVFLDFQVQQGWAPLCQFLGITKEEQHPACPHHDNKETLAVPFPHINDKQAYARILKSMSLFGYIWTILLFFMGYCVLQWCKQKFSVHKKKKNKENNKPKQS